MNAYPAAIVYLSKHMQYAVINYLFPYFLLFNMIPTPILNSNFFKNLVIFNFYSHLTTLYIYFD